MEALQLHFPTDIEIELEKVDAVACEHALELRRLAQEVGELIGRAKPHYLFDAGTVVPGAVEQDDVARRRQMRHIALEIPLTSFDLRRFAERHRLRPARVEMGHEALDGGPLAGRIAAFEQHYQTLAPLLQ